MSCFVIASSAYLTACGSDSDSDDLPLPVPDSFEAYFVAGAVCMPTNIATGTGAQGSAPEYPIRFDICRHRCITIDRTTSFIQTSFQCAAGQCSMMMLAHAPAYRVESEKNCDARELPSPPSSSCTPESFTFNVSPPFFTDSNMYMTGPMQVTVPFMNLDQAEEVQSRVNAGENPQLVIQQVVGPPPADRIWGVNFDPANPVVSDGASLSGADCHTIAAP